MNNQSLNCDVLIVGGGPAGLSVAAALSPQITCVIAHKDAEIGRPVRTSGGTWVRDMQALKIPEHLYQVIDQIDYFSDNEEALFRIQNNKMAVLDITGLYTFLAEQSDHSNRTLLLGAKFTGTQKKDGGLYLSSIKSHAQGPVSVTSKYIVDASGWPHAVLKSLNLAPRPKRLGIGIEYEFPRGSYPKNRVVLFVGSDALHGYGWIFPTAYETVRLGIGVIKPDAKMSPRKAMNAFVASGNAVRYGLEIPAEYEVNTGIVPSVPYRDKLVFDTVIATGDTANFATPTAGEGIRMAIKFGRLLGAELSSQIRGDSQALRRYEQAGRDEFKNDYKYGFKINQRIATYGPKQWDRSIRRLSRLGESEMTQLLRSRFSVKIILRVAMRSVMRKFFR